MTDTHSIERDLAAPQPGILTPAPPLGRSMTFRLQAGGDIAGALARLRAGVAVNDGIVGLGAPLAAGLGREIPGLRPFPALAGPAIGGRATAVPSTQQALWVLLRGPDRSTIFDAGWRVTEALGGAFALCDAMDTFLYRGNRDLTGFEDGTENPHDEKARTAAVVSGGPGLGGSSFVAVQRWMHDLRAFRGFPQARREEIVGRRQDSNEELTDAPASAHVKRTAQESYEPPAFMVRRSMPFATAEAEGLEFIAFVASLDRFERMMARMLGADDGVVDGLFTFSRPVTGGYYWCPPVAGGRLDLSLLGVP